MIVIAKNLGEAPVAVFDRFQHNDDNTVTCVRDNHPDKPNLSQLAAYGSFGWTDRNDSGGWERATLNGQIIAFKQGATPYAYVWFQV